jgi:hypothetical protein
MSIKINVGEQKTKIEKPFPKLMINVQFKFILLMQDYKNGTVLYDPSKHYKIGEFSKYWIEDQLIDFNDPITLQND